MGIFSLPFYSRKGRTPDRKGKHGTLFFFLPFLFFFSRCYRQNGRINDAWGGFSGLTGYHRIRERLVTRGFHGTVDFFVQSLTIRSTVGRKRRIALFAYRRRYAIWLPTLKFGHFVGFNNFYFNFDFIRTCIILTENGKVSFELTVSHVLEILLHSATHKFYKCICKKLSKVVVDRTRALVMCKIGLSMERTETGHKLSNFGPKFGWAC